MTSAKQSRAAAANAPKPLITVVGPPAADATTAPREARIKPALIATVGLFVIVLMGAIWWAKPFLLPVVASMVLATLLAPIVARLEAWRIPRSLGSFIVMTAVVAVLVIAIDILLEPLARMLDSLAAMESFVNRLLRATRHLLGAPFADWLNARLADIAAQKSGAVSADLFAAVIGGSVGVGIVLLLSFFLLAGGDHFLQKLVRVIPRIRDKVNAVRIVRTVQDEVSHYFLAVTLINATLGAIVGLICWYFELPNALLWGALVAVLNYLPYVGPIVNFVFLSVASAAYFSSIGEALVVPLLFAGVTLVEGQLITPMVVGKRVALNPVVVFVGLLFWGWLWGFAGMVLAIPLLLVAKIWAQHTVALAQWSEFLGTNSHNADSAT